MLEIRLLKISCGNCASLKKTVHVLVMGMASIRKLFLFRLQCINLAINQPVILGNIQMIFIYPLMKDHLSCMRDHLSCKTILRGGLYREVPLYHCVALVTETEMITLGILYTFPQSPVYYDNQHATDHRAWHFLLPNSHGQVTLLVRQVDLGKTAFYIFLLAQSFEKTGKFCK